MTKRDSKTLPEWLYLETEDLPEPSALPKPLWLENTKIEQAMDSLNTHPEISAVLKRLWQKDPYNYNHCHRVADLAQWIGQFLSLSNQERVEIYLVGLMHDVGKIFTPDNVLKKPGPLTREEFEIMKKHPEDSANIISNFKDLGYLEPAIRAHHERFDGKGYPDGLLRDKIHIFSRVIFVADTFDAMTTSRVYRKKLDLEVTYQELTDCSGSQFDPEVSKAFVTAHQKLREWIHNKKKAA